MSGWKEQALLLAKDGKLSWRQIGKQLGVPKSTLSDFLRKSDTQVCGGQEKIKPAQRGAKILLIDLETSPTLSYHFGRFNVNISEAGVVQEQIILSAAWKWVGGMSGSYMTSEKGVANGDDSAIAKVLNDLLDDADVVVAHNANGFDIKIANEAFLRHGLHQPTPYKVIDTLSVVKRHFRLPRNKMESVCKRLGLVRKIDNAGMSLWVGVMNGDVEARNEMLAYNIGDIDCLEAVFNNVKGWVTGINMAQYYDDGVVRCTKCGSDHLTPTGKMHRTSVSAFETYRCGNCGGLSRGRANQIKGKSLLMGV